MRPILADRGSVPSGLCAPPRVLLVRGRADIEAFKPLLVELAAITGQAGAADDLAYFLATPDALKKAPCLLLQRATSGEASVRGWCGATLLFEYTCPLGGFRVFATADSTGRRNVLAAHGMRARVAAQAARTLLERGAHIVHIAFQQLPGDPSAALAVAAGLSGMGLVQDPQRPAQEPKARKHLWSVAERSIPLYLPLEPSFDRTLARIGQRTRSNLRYYRRRAERDLRCSFVPEAKLTLAEFLVLNRQCMFAVSDALAAWRFHALTLIADPFLCGVRNSQHGWLALVGGRRRAGEIEIDWQMNRAGLPQYSLCTVARSYLIEHEIARGSTRLYIEGGTPHPIGRSFTEERVADLTVRRRSLYAGLLTRFATRLFPRKNYISQILRDPQLDWRPW